MDRSRDRLAEHSTKKNSLQTYLTIRLLVDRPLVSECFRAYAYFRWADDQVDVRYRTYRDRVAFMNRQKQLVDVCYAGKKPGRLLPHERMITGLIASDPGTNPKLESFIRNFLSVIDFDARRKGRPVTAREITRYSRTLGQAVTDGIEYFIGNTAWYPQSPDRSKAAVAAHITHMLRDMREDIPQGFINIPREAYSDHRTPDTFTNSRSERVWVKHRVKEAQTLFHEGKRYIDSLSVLRTKIAAYWYCARFERLLSVIEREGYALRPRYDRGRNAGRWVRLLLLTASVTVKHIIGRIAIIPAYI